MNSHTLKLMHPVSFGQEPVTELTVSPNARFYKGMKLTAAEGSVTYEPYELAVIGARMAGRPAAERFVDLMHPSDMNALAAVVMGFLGPAQTTGNSPSES